MKCEAILAYTEGITTIANEIIKTKKCTFPAYYQCGVCGKNLCSHHAIGDTEPYTDWDIARGYTSKIFCKDCHPDPKMRTSQGNILVEEPR
jgi:hypothetical protein